MRQFMMVKYRVYASDAVSWCPAQPSSDSWKKEIYRQASDPGASERAKDYHQQHRGVRPIVVADHHQYSKRTAQHGCCNQLFSLEVVK